MPQCCVIGCFERPDKKSAKNISFHGFPRREKSPKRYDSWVKKISRVDFVPNRMTVVCSKHFKNEDFEVSPIVVQNLEVKPKVALKKGAVPSKYLKGKETVKKRSKRASKRLRQKKEVTPSTNGTHQEQTVEETVKKRSTRASKCVHQKRVAKITKVTPSTSGTNQKQTVEEISELIHSTFSSEVQCELGSEVFRKYWLPPGTELTDEAAKRTKFPRNNTYSTYTAAISDLEFSNDKIKTEEDNDSDTLTEDIDIDDNKLFFIKCET